MRKAIIPFVICLFLTVAPAQADPEAHFPFKPLAFLAGACWKGILPDGKPDTHCFNWLYDRKFLQDDHIVQGKDSPYEGKTLYSWNSKNQRIEYSYYNSLGGISTGAAFPHENGEIHFPETYEHDGVTRHFRSIWRPDQADSYLSLLEEKTEKGWSVVWQVRYHRTENQPR